MRRAALAVSTSLIAFAPAAFAARAPVFGGDVSGLYRQRPVFIHLTSDQNLRQIHWSSWGGPIAHGNGILRYSVSDKTPPVAVKLSLSGLARCGRRQQYLRLKITYAAAKSDTVRYSCRSPF